MEDEKQVEQDRQRAEIFDALGHPTRILILKVLSEGSLGFADLKKKTAIESSGHLQHHLTKLDGLIKNDEFGKYCLSEQGKDALLTVQTVENVSEKSSFMEKKYKRHFNAHIGLKPVAFLLVALLIATTAIALLEYNQTSGFNKENSFLKGINSEAAAYYNEFGAVIPITNVNSSFAPPISMYQALLIGLEANGWNKTSLDGMTVGAYLMPYDTYGNSSFIAPPSAFINGTENWSQIGTNANNPYTVSNRTTFVTAWVWLMPWQTANNFTPPTYETIYVNQNLNVTSPPSNYSDITSNGIVYRYVWAITIQNTILTKETLTGTVPYQIFVDASTGEIFHAPPLY
jgi:DNA-binding HxlR family transcriptional regulator